MANYALSGSGGGTQISTMTTQDTNVSTDVSTDVSTTNIDELRQFLVLVDETQSPEELSTFSDKFVDAEGHIRVPGSKKTNVGNTGKVGNADNASNTGSITSKKGSLSAEAILSLQVASPTGTQLINTLNIDANKLTQFESLRTIRFGELHRKLAQFVPQLQATWGDKNFYRVPADSFNGLCGLLDPLALSEYVPHVEEIIDLSEQQIQDCFVAIKNVDGYPTIDGLPIWERNSWERVDYYNLFKLFRDMRYAFYNESDALVTNRSLAVLAKAVNLAPTVLHHLAQVYHWGLRASLYDTWMDAQQQIRRAVKKELMLDRHEKISQALITKAFNCLSKNAEKMSSKDALAMLELGLKYERISQGLLSDRPDGSTTSKSTPLISVVNQTNNTTGPLQVNNETNVQRALADDMRRPDTLTSILSVLQRSGALDTTLNRAARELRGENVDIVAEIVAEEGTE